MRWRAFSGDSFILRILALLEAVFQSVDELSKFSKNDEGTDGDKQR